MFRLVEFVPSVHTLRPARQIVNLTFKSIDPLLLGMGTADMKGGLPTMAPDRFLRVMMLQVFFCVGSERNSLSRRGTTYSFAGFSCFSWSIRLGYSLPLRINLIDLLSMTWSSRFSTKVHVIANANACLSDEYFIMEGIFI